MCTCCLVESDQLFLFTGLQKSLTSFSIVSMMVEPSWEVSTTMSLDMNTLPTEWYKEWKTTKSDGILLKIIKLMFLGLAEEIGKAMVSLAKSVLTVCPSEWYKDWKLLRQW